MGILLSWRALARGLLGTAGIGALLALAGCSEQGLSFLDPAGPVAQAQLSHFINVTLITLIVVVPVLVLVPLIAWRYRYRGNAKYAPRWSFSMPLEIVMWGVPVLIVIALGWVLLRDTYEFDPYRPIAGAQKPLEVDVIGLDWKWLFVYPEQGVASVGELVLPEGRPVTMRLTSDTVMQSFFVGALASQIYAMPAMETQLNLLADKTGTFRGTNTQFTGFGFQHQEFPTLVKTPADFDAWVAQAKAKGIALDTSSYATLGQRSSSAQAAQTLGNPDMPKGVLWFSSVPKDFFAGVIAKYTDGKALPRKDQPGAADYAAPATAH